MRHSGQDHLLSRSFYVADPDGNRIEITHPTPGRGTIGGTADGRIRGETAAGQAHSILEPLDLSVLRATLPQGTPVAARLPDGTLNGHIHVRTRDLSAAFAVYRGLPGVVSNLFAPLGQFCDLGRPDHPHMIAVNTWAGDRLVDAPRGAAGMNAFALVMADSELAASRLRKPGHGVEDTGHGLACIGPDGNRVILVPA